MTLMLDADILNYVLKRISPVREQFDEMLSRGVPIVQSSVVHYQLTRYYKLKGARRSLSVYRRLVSRWPLVIPSKDDWDLAADLWAERHRAGRPIDDADLLIAVTARKASAVLVTNNLRHFEGLGLTLRNWAA